MAGLRLGGLASGVDTETIISQLMALESQPKTRLLTQQKLAEGRKTALEDVARQLRGLATTLADLKSVATWGDVQSVTSSDSAKVGVRQVGAAPAGNVTVEVTKLAAVEQHFYTWGQPDPAFAIDGVAVDLSAATDAQSAAAKINATTGITVYAGVVNDQLVLTAKELGRDITVTGQGGLALAREVDKQFTEYTVNGQPQDRTTSTVVQPGGLPGLELTLKGTTSGPVTLSVGAPAPDADKVKTKVKAFVDAYNATIDTIRTKLSEKKVANPTTTAQFVQGALRGDVALSSLLSNMRGALAPVADATTAIDTLAELGIAPAKPVSSGDSTPEALAGKLTLDADKLAAALAADPDAVQRVLGGDATAMAQRLESMLDPITKSGTGYIATAQGTADQQARTFATRQTEFDRKLALREDRLRSMFTAMEQAMSASQSQSAWLSGQLAGLPTWG